MKEDIKQIAYKTLMLIVVIAIITFVITSIINYDSSVRFLLPKNKDTSVAEQTEETISKVIELLENKYLGEINNSDVIDGAIKGAVASLGDKYTEYYTAEELKDFESSAFGNFIGIGVTIQANTENNTIKVLEVMEGSPAEKAGLQVNDLIVKADGTTYNAEQISELSDYLMDGEIGTEITLTILRDKKTLDLKVERDIVDINYILNTMLENNIGYIAITSFDEDCAKDFISAYNKLLQEGARSLIVDLRGNGGGVVEQALEITDLFCDKDETMLITMDKNENKTIEKSESDRTITMPTILLTDGATASASEIFAAALRDNNKAEIVGEKTFGKGIIQSLIYLSNGGALKVTSAEYYTPNGNKINEIGITPDYEIADGEEQVNKAIEILKNK